MSMDDNKSSISEISKLVSGCKSSNLQTQIECTRKIRILISSPNNSPIQEVVESGIIPRIIQFCKKNKFPELQYESLWVLVNIASGPAECTSYLIQQGAHTLLIELLQNPLYEICEQALWALGNIAGDGQELKDLLLNSNILQPILVICTSSFDKQFVTNFNHVSVTKKDTFCKFKSLLVTASWTLSNLCRSSTAPTIKYLEDLITCLQRVFQKALSMSDTPYAVINNAELTQKEDIIMNVGWSFSYLTTFDQYNALIMDKMKQLGILQQFVKLMDNKSAIVRQPINRLMSNILTGKKKPTKQIIFGVLSQYRKVLTGLAFPKEQTEICWSISTVCAGPIEDKLLVLKSNLYPILIVYLSDKPSECANQTLYAISALIGVTNNVNVVECITLKPIIKALVEYGVLDALTRFLTKNTKINRIHVGKNKILVVALECIEKIIIDGNMNLCTNNNINIYAPLIDECGIVHCLENLQLQKNEENINISAYAYGKCADIIKTHFSGSQDMFKVYNKYYVWPLVFGYVKQVQIDCKLSTPIPMDIVQTLLLFSLLKTKK